MLRSSYGKSKGKHLQNLQNQTRLKLTLLIKTVDKGETLPKKPAKITDMRDSLVRFTKADIIYLFIYLFIYLYIYLSIYLFIYLFIYLSIYFGGRGRKDEDMLIELTASSVQCEEIS